MKIHAYILCYNEEMILPFTLDYYSKYCEKIILLDNESTDRSRKIAAKYPKVSVVSWSSNNQINDFAYVQLKSSIYKNSRGIADWVIVCDCDEIVYNLDLLHEIKKHNICVPHIEGYHMVHDRFPEYTGELITTKVKTGFRDFVFDKQVIFDPDVDMTFGIGAHTHTCLVPRDESIVGLKLLHYKYLGVDYVHMKNQRSLSRLSDINKKFGFGDHYKNTFEDTKASVEYHLNNSKEII